VTDTIRVLLCVDCSLGTTSPLFASKPSLSQLFTKTLSFSFVTDESFRLVRWVLHRRGRIASYLSVL